MNIRAFLRKYKAITYTILASYLLMSISQSYAMESGAEAGKFKHTSSMNTILPEGMPVLKIDMPDEKNRVRTESKDTDINGSPFWQASPADVKEVSLLDCVFGQGHGIASDSLVALSATASDATKEDVKKISGPDTKNIELIEDSLTYQLLALEDGVNLATETEIYAARIAETHDVEKAGGKSQDLPKIESEAWKKVTINVGYPFFKSLSSFSVSLIASTGLALFAYNLGLQANEILAYMLWSDALLSNTILYHKNIMGLSLDDLKVDLSGSLSRDAQIFCFVVLKFSIALVSSIPLAFVTYLANSTQLLGLSYSSCVTSLACTILLFYKAQTALVNYIKYISNLVNEKNETKKSRGWDAHNAIEELSALDRGEVHDLHDKLRSLKAVHSDGNIPAEEFKAFTLHMLPKELDTLNRFRIKESVAASFGVFSAVFGGMYLFLVSNPIYEAFLPAVSDGYGLGFLSKNYKDTALSGAIAVTIGQNALQAKNSYDISKIYAIKLIRSYEKRILKRHTLLSTKRDIGCMQQSKEYALDISKVILAGGAAITRAALALKYIENPALLACVLVGTDISYFTTFLWGMNYIESGTEIEIKRAEILAFLNNQKKNIY